MVGRILSIKMKIVNPFRAPVRPSPPHTQSGGHCPNNGGQKHKNTNQEGGNVNQPLLKTISNSSPSNQEKRPERKQQCHNLSSLSEVRVDHNFKFSRFPRHYCR